MFEMDNNEWLAACREVCWQGLPGTLLAGTAVIQAGSSGGMYIHVSKYPNAWGALKIFFSNGRKVAM